MRKYLLIIALLMPLAACGSSDKVSLDKAPAATSVEELYNAGADALDRGEYRLATLKFEEVERQYPYSVWATRAELMAAFASYKGQRYDEASLALDRFIELHPGNEDIDYALYLKSLSYYEQISDVARDQGLTEEALRAFETLLRRFPDSKYARDARLKRDLTLDHLAGKEMEIGRYYLNRKELNAAINRFKRVVENYQTTTHIPEALHRLVEAFLTIGLKQEATRVAAVLGHNYPGSRWYQDSYALLDERQRQALLEDRDWLDITVDTLFKPD